MVERLEKDVKYLNLTRKMPERHRFGVVVVNFEHVLTFNKEKFAGNAFRIEN